MEDNVYPECHKIIAHFRKVIMQYDEGAITAPECAYALLASDTLVTDETGPKIVAEHDACRREMGEAL